MRRHGSDDGHGRDRFEWNAGASQPKILLSRRRRLIEGLRDLPSYLRFAGAGLRQLPHFAAQYRRLRQEVFPPEPAPSLVERLGMGLSAAPGSEEAVVEAFLELGLRRALVRLPYRSGGEAPWSEAESGAQHRLIELLLARECEVVVAVPQDRLAVTDPAGWGAGLTAILERYHGRCPFFQIGQAINRRKWGLWTVEEYVGLLEPAFEFRDRHPEVGLIGPPVLDAELHYYPAVLGAMQRSGESRFDRLTSQLYVDRQGPPERTHWGWSLVEKCTAVAAVGAAADYPPERVWITETNWPLRDQGEFAPARGDVEVDEDRYASYMVRYLLLALASGMVGRVYWWQLVARGYGLLDNSCDPPRRRPAFFALRTLVEQLGGARFEARLDRPGAAVLRFTDAVGRGILVAWRLPPGESSPTQVVLELERRPEQVVGRDGRDLAGAGRTIELDPSPIYVRGEA